MNNENYFVGFDIGTDSVGYAVANDNYELCKFKGEPQKLEHNDIQWIMPSEIPNYEFCLADKEILQKLIGDQ